MLSTAVFRFNIRTGRSYDHSSTPTQLAAAAILAGRPATFDRRWRDAYLARFESRLKMAPLLENRWLLDAAIAAGKLPWIGARLFHMIGGF